MKNEPINTYLPHKASKFLSSPVSRAPIEEVFGHNHQLRSGLDLTMICKILSTLPPRFRHLHVAWDNVPRNEQTMKSLTVRLLKEESRNRVQEFMENKEEKVFSSSCGQGSSSNRRLFSRNHYIR